jgi:hypothetical protein
MASYSQKAHIVNGQCSHLHYSPFTNNHSLHQIPKELIVLIDFRKINMVAFQFI